MSAKSKSDLSGTPNTKALPATKPRIQATKPSKGVAEVRADSTSSLQTGGISVDRSSKPVALKTTKPVASKTTVDRSSPKLSTPPDKKPTRILKPSERQTEVHLIQEDLKKANEKLVLVESEKAKALDEVKEANRLSKKANENLRKALEAQKRAEEDHEIEKFQALEIEQVAIEAARRKEAEWRKELEAVKNEHAADVAALLTATQELQNMKQELAMTCDAKNQALSHADDATKIAEIHAEKVKALGAEVVRLTAVLDTRIEVEAIENNKLVSDLRLEIDSLRQQLEKVKCFEEELTVKEATLEQLNVDLEAAKMAECYTCKLVEELHERVEELTSQTEEVKRLEKSMAESLESVTKQLGEKDNLLRDAESEIAFLKEKVGSLEMSTERQKEYLEESGNRLELAEAEAFKMVKKVEFLESELQAMEEEKTKASNNENVASASLRTLSEENNNLVKELETSRDKEEKSKKELENLASALHEVSSEARDAKEKLFSIQVENENYEKQIEDLRQVTEATNEKYERMLNDAKRDIDTLTNSVEQSKHNYDNLKAGLEEKELHLMKSVKKSEDDKFGMENEIDRLAGLLKLTEEKACATKEEGDRWRNSFQEAKSEVIHLKEVVLEVKVESMRLKEGLMDRENELEKFLLENEELREREVASLTKVEVLSKQLEEALAKNKEEETLDLTDSEKDYDVLPKWTSIMQKENPSEFNDVFNDESAQKASEVKNSKEKDNADSVEVVDLQMWESCKIDEKDLSPDRLMLHESFEDEMESKAEDGDLHDHVNGVSSRENLENGGTSPSKLSSSQKKKKPLLRKFGNLLKKKSPVTQK